MILDYVALAIMIFLIVTLAYAVVYIQDVPFELSKKRNHPHQDAIHVAGWISLFTLHVIWPLLWIWAMMYKPDHGYGFEASGDPDRLADLKRSVDVLGDRVAALEKQPIGR